MDNFPIIAIRCYDDLITAIRAVKNFLQISDADFELLAGLTRGHWSKIAGATPTKRMGVVALNTVLGALAIELHVKRDMAAVERLSHRWEKRVESQVRVRPLSISQALLDRCRPIILAELGHAGGHRKRQGASPGAAAQRTRLGHI